MRFDTENEGRRVARPTIRRMAWWSAKWRGGAPNGRAGLRISSLRWQPPHVLLRLSNHGLHKGLHDSRDRFTGHTHSTTGLPAVFDQLVHFGSQAVSGRSDGDLVFRNSHFALLPES